MRAAGAARLVFQLFTTCHGGGGWVGVLDETKAILSPAGACLWAELGKKLCQITQVRLDWIISQVS